VVWGGQPHNFFTILMNTLDLILDRFEGLRIQREIPCICHWQHEKQVHCPNFFRYELLVRRMDAKRYEVECPESFQMVSVPELLYGIHTSTNDQVIADIRQSQQELIQGQKQVLEISTEMATFLKEINQRAELIWRALLRQWNFEMKRMEAECPNIFFLTLTKKADFTSQNWMHRLVQDGKKRFNPQNWVSQEYGLYLVCQHPSGPHPVGEGYSLREAKDWWINVNPWLNYLVSFLKVAIPVGKAFGDVYDTIDFDHMSHQIALMEEITNNIPALANLDTLANGVPEPHLNHDQQVVGPALRALYNFLHTVDPAHTWGGLYKTVTLDGNILWLCNTHRQQYEAKPLDERYLR
jgi:internalin A